MAWILLTVLFLSFCFGFVLLFGAPYVPTLTKQVKSALDLADLQPGQTLLELGCGDGKVLIAAAERGWTAIGYELNPILAGLAWLRTRRYGKRVKVICGNFWSVKWPQADAIFVFLLDKYMVKLDTKIAQNYSRASGRPLKLVSFAFAIPDKKPDEIRDGVFLYKY